MASLPGVDPSSLSGGIGLPGVDPSQLAPPGTPTPGVGLARRRTPFRPFSSAMDPLGLWNKRPKNLYHFQDLVKNGDTQDAFNLYQVEAIKAGHDPNDALRAAHNAISAAQNLNSHQEEAFRQQIASGQTSIARASYAQQLINRGLDSASAYAAADTAIARERLGLRRPTSALGVIGGILSIPQHIVAEFMRGTHQYLNTHDDSGLNAMWQIFPALASGAVDVATHSPLSKYGIEDYLAQRAAAGDMPLLKNRVIQFGLSTVLDPITYLSFGATAGAKIAAGRQLAYAWENSAKEATALLQGRGNTSLLKGLGLHRQTWKMGDQVVHTVMDHQGNVVRYDDLWNMVHMYTGRPVSLSDALKDMRNVGLARKQDQLLHPISQFQARRAAGQGAIGAALGTASRAATSVLLPTNVKGGRGVRFAGLEVPGTPALGARLGKSSREAVATRAAAESKPTLRATSGDVFGAPSPERAPLVRGLLGAFKPRWRSGIVADDASRALATFKLNEFRFRKSGLEGEAGKKVSELARVWDNGQLIPPEVRRGLLKGEAPPTAELHNLKTNINAEVSRIRSIAVQAGFKENSFDSLWRLMIEKHDDPLNALAEFKYRAESAIISRQFIHELLDNPMFARRWYEQRTEENFSNFAHYGENPPEGYIPFTWDNKKYVVKASIHDALDEFASVTPMDRSADDFLKLLRLPQDFWRVYATTPNPSFHVMNFLGAVWNNMYAGVYNPMDYIKALGTLYNARLEQLATEGRRAIIQPGRLPFSKAESTASTAKASVVYGSAAARGGLGRQSIFQELVTGKTMARLPGELTKRQRLKEIVTRHPDESRKRYAFRQSRRGVGVAAIATANPVVAGIAFAPELAGVGRKVGTTIEDVVRLAPYMKAAKDPDSIKLLERYGPIRVPGLKHPGFTKQQQSAMYDIGAAISTHFQFDYGDLTNFERKWAKTFFPFWVFYKNNFLLQAATVVNRPRFVNSALALQNYISENGVPLGPEAELLPNYFDNLDAFQIPVPDWARKRMGLPLKEPLFLNPKLPFVSLNLFPPLWEVTRNNGLNDAQRFGLILSSVMGSVGPWAPFPVPGAKVILEAWVNTQLGLNQKIDYQRASSNDVRQSFVDAPGYMKYVPEAVRNFLGAFPVGQNINPFSPQSMIEITPGQFKMTATSRYILDQMATPFITNIGRSAVAVEPGEAGAKGTADLISWLTGVRLMPVDTLKMHRSWVYQLRDMYQAERARLKQLGKQPDPEDDTTYHYLLAAAKILEAAYDKRAAEMYGSKNG